MGTTIAVVAFFSFLVGLGVGVRFGNKVPVIQEALFSPPQPTQPAVFALPVDNVLDSAHDLDVLFPL